MTIENVNAGAAAAGAAGGDGAAGTAVAEEERIDAAAPGGEGGAGGGDGGGTGEGGAPGSEEELSLDLGATEQHPEWEDFDRDGRTIDKSTREALATLAKTDKPTAKVLRDLYFSNRAVMNEFPESKTLGDAMRAIRQQKATLEALGGDEGIETMQSELQDWRTEMQQFSEGSTELIGELYGSDPKGLMTAGSNILDLLYEKNIDQFDDVILPSFVKRLEKAGFPALLGQIAGFLREAKGQEAYDHLAKMGQWWDNTKKSATKASEGRQARDPRQEEHDRQKQALDQEKRNFYDSQINEVVTRHNNSAIRKISSDVIKQQNLSGERLRDFEQGLLNRVLAAMKLDKPFQRNAAAIKSKGDVQATARFINDKFLSMLPAVFRDFRNMRFPSTAKRAAPANGANGKGTPAKGGNASPASGTGGNKGGGGAASADGFVEVNVMPKRDEIDWNKTTDDMYHIGRGEGRAVLKKGQKVKWDWTKASRAD